MSYKIRCPFCGDIIVSDVVDNIEQVNGEWQCNNGHTFILEYVETIN